MKRFISLILLIVLFSTHLYAHCESGYKKHKYKKQTVVFVKPTLEDSVDWDSLTVEQQIVANWINDNNRGRLSAPKIFTIVKRIYALSNQAQVDPLTICALIMQESTYNPNAQSKSGAKGLTQVLMKYHRDKFAGRSPYNPTASIEVGIQIYKEYLDASNGSIFKALQIYSGGWRNKDKKYPKEVLARKRKLQQYVVFNMFSNPPHDQNFNMVVASN